MFQLPALTLALGTGSCPPPSPVGGLLILWPHHQAELALFLVPSASSLEQPDCVYLGAWGVGVEAGDPHRAVPHLHLDPSPGICLRPSAHRITPLSFLKARVP